MTLSRQNQWLELGRTPPLGDLEDPDSLVRPAHISGPYQSSRNVA